MSQYRKLITTCDRCDAQVVQRYEVDSTTVPDGVPHRWRSTKVQYVQKDLCPDCLADVVAVFQDDVVRKESA